ncbi:hypothetical protein [Desulfovibrio aminophilus]
MPHTPDPTIGVDGLLGRALEAELRKAGAPVLCASSRAEAALKATFRGLR